MDSDVVMDHFRNPRNAGEIPDADGVGQVGNPMCGDMITMYIKVRDGVLSQVKFKSFGCGATIAVSSVISEMATGKTIDEAGRITTKEVAKALGGLPKNQLHCSNLGADALRLAIKDHQDRLAGKPARSAESREPVHRTLGGRCACPYCNVETAATDAVCRHCGGAL